MRRNLLIASSILVAILAVMVGTTCMLAPTSQPAAAPSQPVTAATVTVASSAVTPASSPAATVQPSPSSQAAPSPTTRPAAVSSPAAAEWWDRENDPDPALAQEVHDAYSRFWQVRTAAFFTLDPMPLHTVEAGSALERDEKAIAELKSQGRAQRLEVDHSSRVVFATHEEAVVYDEYTSRSTFVDANTKQDLPTDSPPRHEAISTLLSKSDGAWKVIDGVRHE